MRTPKYSDLQETGTCALCSGPYSHWGNNPEPIYPYEMRVCDDCNMDFVVPIRLKKVFNRNGGAVPLTGKDLREIVAKK